MKQKQYDPDSAMKSGTSKGRTVNLGLVDQPMVQEDGKEMYEPQSMNDKRGSSYDNDVPANWLRGMGKGEAEGKPSFDKRKKG
jgi:hypothetical protein